MISVEAWPCAVGLGRARLGRARLGRARQGFLWSAMEILMSLHYAAMAQPRKENNDYSKF